MGGGVTDRETAPGQWDVRRAHHELNVADASHRRTVEVDWLGHDLREQEQDNAQRRPTFSVVLGTVVAALVVAFLPATLSGNATTRAWVQGVVSFIMDLGEHCRRGLGLFHGEEREVAGGTHGEKPRAGVAILSVNGVRAESVALAIAVVSGWASLPRWRLCPP